MYYILYKSLLLHCFIDGDESCDDESCVDESCGDESCGGHLSVLGLLVSVLPAALAPYQEA